MIEAYPLAWPVGYPRTLERESSLFKTTPDACRKELLNEIKLLSGDTAPIISSNVPLRKKDNSMYADIAREEIFDPGVAVYFDFLNDQRVIACDYWLTPMENMRACSNTIQALRGIGRWKASQILERSFTGLKALPAAIDNDMVWNTLGLSSKPADMEIVHKAYKRKAIILHPDSPTGSAEAFHQLQQAYTLAKFQYN